MTSTFTNFNIYNLEETSFIGGTYKELSFDVTDESGSPIDVSSYTYKWMLYPYGMPESPVLSVSGSSRKGDGFANRFTIYLSSMDTASLSGKYVQQPVVVVAEGVEFRVAQGNVIIVPAAGYMTVTETETLSEQVSDIITTFSGSITTNQTSISTLSASVAALPRWTFLTAPLTSTLWDGDAHSDEAVTFLDLPATFGVPSGAKAVILRITLRDSVAWGTDGLYLNIGPNATYYYMGSCSCYGGDVRSSTSIICSCDANTYVWYRINASGAGTMDIWIEVWGYLL